ncbi:MAG: hypothetical protein A2341_14920 [Deltaproteobacteria bacterium RIFOXYB12_FULL_58_9]|nr:MAG: hypothetical protein A2341_14920 [Deltaproteobacteria bacterium RIFOXYB12_FULL_58_9]
MEMVDAEWIKARLTGKHGEQQRLADALGISPDKVNKILSGARRVQPAEIPRVLSFFGEDGAVTDEEKQLLAIWRRIPQWKHEAVAAALRLALDEPDV